MSNTESYKKLLTMSGDVLPVVAVQMLRNQEIRDGQRDFKHLHPSELSKKDWCPRASWYTITADEKPPIKPMSYQRLNIFAEGHAIHAKWQKWMWEAGVLEGRWYCRNCGHRWWDVSPKNCPDCSAHTHNISYDEVPVNDDKHMLLGHADGIFTSGKKRALIEIKSVGMGTVRMEAPDIHRQYSDGQLTYDGVWKALRQPFATHIRQGMLYMHATGIHKLIFIYEWKASQEIKEFSIEYMPELVKPILDNCLRVRDAIEDGIPPERPAWAETPTHTACKSCHYNERCWKG